MLTNEIRNQIDQIWNAFWSGGISNPLEVIEQITYLLFIKRLDELHTLEELKATRLKAPIERRVLSRGRRRPSRSPRPYADYRWSRFKNFAPAEMYEVVGRARLPVPSNDWAATSLRTRTTCGMLALRFRLRAASEGGGSNRPCADGRSRHEGRSLRIHAE